jgi:hypothetical protein
MAICHLIEGCHTHHIVLTHNFCNFSIRGNTLIFADFHNCHTKTSILLFIGVLTQIFFILSINHSTSIENQEAGISSHHK